MFDAITLASVTDELNKQILHGRVQEVVALDALSFGLEIYAQHQRYYLYLTAAPDDARVHLVAQKLRASGEPPSPFLLLLRKHIDNALINAITQLPHERVLQIQFDHVVEGISTLVVETIGRYSNLILIDAGGVVMDAVKRIDAAKNRARVILPKRDYAPPPPQSKLAPQTLTPDALARVLAENPNAALAPLLVKTIAGVSPLLAREIQYRVGADTRAEQILATLQQLSHAPWQPSVAYENDEPASFASYPITHSPNHQIFPSISAAIETFYGAVESYAAVKDAVGAKARESRDRLARKRDALTQSLPRAEEIERLKTSGELVLAYASQVKTGQTWLEAETETGMVDISLNPHLSAVENAQKYFKEYKRAKDAAARVPALLNAANADVEYAEQMLNDLELAENRAEIDAVVQAAREAGLIAAPRVKARVTPSEPRAFQSRDGFTILVGRNARQNEQVTFQRAKSDDLWLHARGVAGAHVVIVSDGRAIPETTLQDAAKLAAQFSQARAESRVDVVVTERRNVRRAKDGKAGMVTVRGESVVRVEI